MKNFSRIVLIFSALLLFATTNSMTKERHLGKYSALAEHQNHIAHKEELSLWRSLKKNRARDRTKIEKNWDYWSAGIGFGMGTLVFDDARLSIRKSLLQNRLQRNTPDKNRPFFFPDIRLSVEKSMLLSERVSAMLDLSLFTPTIRLGYIIDENSRVGFGLSFWTPDGMHITLKRQQERFSSQLLGSERRTVEESEEFVLTDNLHLSPSINYDQYVSKSLFLRTTLSYHQFTIEKTKESLTSVSEFDEKQTLHWPQLMLSAHFRW